VPPPDTPAGRVGDALLRSTSRRGFLERAGQALVALAGGATVARALLGDEADAYTNFCGHTYTTANCPHPTGLPRVDRHGLPLRARDGKPVDDLGRPIGPHGRPLSDLGHVLLDPDGRPLPPATRTPICKAVARDYEIHTTIDGAWFRCCGGRVRKLIDCCSHSRKRINGDSALNGYCYAGRKVFCVMYYDTKVPC
jgi:hypothetical protein